MSDTLHFRAENFEATATRVDLPTPERSAERNITHYVISPRGEASKTLCLYRPEKEPLGGIVPFRGAQVSIMTPWGWKEIAMRVTAEDPELLALAISLLYSVPGVEAYEPKSRDVIPPDRCPECRLLLPEHRMMCSWEEVKP